MSKSILDESVINFRSSGESLASIGARYGVSPQAVQRYLRRRKVATSAISKHFCYCGKPARRRIDGEPYCGKACWRKRRRPGPAYQEAKRRAARYLSMAGRSIGFVNGDQSDASLPNLVVYDSPVMGRGQIVWRGVDMVRLRRPEAAHQESNENDCRVKKSCGHQDHPCSEMLADFSHPCLSGKSIR